LADELEIAWRYAGAVHNEDWDPGTGDGEGDVIRPAQALTISNFPNPFNPMTEIRIDAVGVSGRDIPYTLSISDVRGVVVYRREGLVGPSGEVFSWDGVSQNGAKMPAGVYNVRVETTTRISTKKIALLK
jgi:hypothetical protein